MICFLTGSSRLIKDCKENLATKFDMKDLGLMHYFLVLEVWQQKGELSWSRKIHYRNCEEISDGGL